MQRPHDERAKLIAERTLDLLGEVQREKEVPTSDAQRMDLWFQRLRHLAPVPGYLALLDVLFPIDCIIEAFCQAVALEDFWESHRKQYGWRHYLQEQARPASAPEAAGARVLLRPPFLWLLSAGRPQSLFDEYRLSPRPEFPDGIYDFDSGWRIGLIVVGELPAGKPTLLLRLMGSFAVRREALEEIRRLPDIDPDKVKLLRIVAALRHTMRHATNISDEDREEFMSSTFAEFERYEEELKQGSRKEGQKEGQNALCEAIVDLCELLGIPVSAEQQAQLAAMDLDRLVALKNQIKRTRSWTN